MGWFSKKDPAEKRTEEQAKVRRVNRGSEPSSMRERRRNEERAAMYRTNGRHPEDY
ncbi:hypothetical protein ACLQ2R_17080 [Streptosporangium sp. DT93]|uniref:hypothetical protein n=1 Tax=Streptosporangium sp. DT93 TaxID=3393428 RepID=UPI003CF3916D